MLEKSNEYLSNKTNQNDDDVEKIAIGDIASIEDDLSNEDESFCHYDNTNKNDKQHGHINSIKNQNQLHAVELDKDNKSVRDAANYKSAEVNIDEYIDVEAENEADANFKKGNKEIPTSLSYNMYTTTITTIATTPTTTLAETGISRNLNNATMSELPTDVIRSRKQRRNLPEKNFSQKPANLVDTMNEHKKATRPEEEEEYVEHIMQPANSMSSPVSAEINDYERNYFGILKIGTNTSRQNVQKPLESQKHAHQQQTLTGILLDKYKSFPHFLT